MQEELNTIQEDFRPEDPMQDDIVKFIENTKEDYICVKMIFFEALGNSMLFDKPTYKESRQIAAILDNIPGWSRGTTHNFASYGTEKVWIRNGITPSEEDSHGFIPATEQMSIPFLEGD